MALKSDFEEASFISSPYVDEVANPGVPGISNEEVERQAVRANQLFLAKEAAKTPSKSVAKATKTVAFTGDTRGTVQKVADNRSAQQKALDAALGRK